MRVIFLVGAFVACHDRAPRPGTTDTSSYPAAASASRAPRVEGASDQRSATTATTATTQTRRAPPADVADDAVDGCEALLWLALEGEATLMPLFDDGELQRVAARRAGLSINGKVQIVPLPEDAVAWATLPDGAPAAPRAAGVQLGGAEVALALAYQTKQHTRKLALVRWPGGKPVVLATVDAAVAQVPEGLAVADALGGVKIYQLGHAGVVATPSPHTLAVLCAAPRP